MFTDANQKVIRDIVLITIKEISIVFPHFLPTYPLPTVPKIKGQKL